MTNIQCCVHFYTFPRKKRETTHQHNDCEQFSIRCDAIQFWFGCKKNFTSKFLKNLTTDFDLVISWSELLFLSCFFLKRRWNIVDATVNSALVVKILQITQNIDTKSDELNECFINIAAIVDFFFFFCSLCKTISWISHVYQSRWVSSVQSKLTFMRTLLPEIGNWIFASFKHYKNAQQTHSSFRPKMPKHREMNGESTWNLLDWMAAQTLLLSDIQIRLSMQLIFNYFEFDGCTKHSNWYY